MWRFIDLDKIDGVYSAALFESMGMLVGSGYVPETILFWRVYSPVVYLGYHQCVEDEIHADFCKANNISIVRRILGGGCGFCDDNQILYSVIGREGGVIPNDIQDAYRKVLGGVLIALESLGEESEIEPARNAVYSRGRKISGNAQGRFDGAVLINGSLLLDFDFKLMDRVLKNPTKNLKPVECAGDGMITLKEIGFKDFELVKRRLRNGFEKALGISSEKGELTKREEKLSTKLLEKYQKHDWTYKMDTKRGLRKKSFVPLPQ
jgi:lipoate-protein ligase A